LFKKDIDSLDLSLDAVKNPEENYKTYVSSMGYRFTIYYDAPCALVLMENGKIRYVSSLKYLRELKGWNIGHPIPQGSVAYRLKPELSKTQDYDKIAANI